MDLSKGAVFGLIRGATAAMLTALIVAALPAQESRQNERRPQTRPHGRKIEVPVDAIQVDDGDTVRIRWAGGDVETVRILGIDAPEVQHLEHGIPFDQPFGRESLAFASGVFALADRVELLRASMTDPYGRTLGYLFANGKNFSVLALRHRMAVETVSVFGDNGFPELAAECTRAAAEAGQVAFEPPYLFRRRMRAVSDRMRREGN